MSRQERCVRRGSGPTGWRCGRRVEVLARQWGRVPPGSLILRFFEHCYFSKNSSKQPKQSPGLALSTSKFQKSVQPHSPHPPPPFFNSPAGPDANWHACLLPWGRGTSGQWGKAEPEPRPLLPAQNSFPPCPPPPTLGERKGEA